MQDNILIGTSGYDYPEWKGVFYPEELKRADFLSYYATQFNALELNNTFYNMPTAERLMSFYKRSEGKLAFSIKANHQLTHEIPQNWKTVSDEFKTAVNPLQEKACLSAVLFQLPESFHYTKENRIYLAELIKSFEGYPTVIEFRHREWVRESVFEGLAERNTGIVFCDMPQLKNLPDGNAVHTPFIGSTAYIRLHGRNADAWYAHAPKAQTLITSTHASGTNVTHAHDSSMNGSSRYCYDYSESELNSFVPVIKTAAAEGKKVHVFFNNHPNGSGAKNGLYLKSLLEAQVL